MAAFGLTLGALSSLFHTNIYLLELPAHFQLQYWMAGLFLTLIMVLVPYKTPRLVCGLMTFALTISFLNIAPWLNFKGRVTPSSSPPPADIVTVLQANVFKFNFTAEPLIDTIKTVNPDIIVLSEVTPKWADALDFLYAEWPHQVVLPQEGSHGMAVYSKLPFTRTDTAYMTPRDIPAFILDIEKNDRQFTLVSVHTLPPVRDSFYDNRNRHFSWIRRNFKDLAERPLIIAGDFNTTMYAPAYKSFIADTNLNNAREGRGLMNSWYIYRQPYLGLPIDHFLHSDGIKIDAAGRGPDIHSDHRPLITQFHLRDLKEG